MLNKFITKVNKVFQEILLGYESIFYNFECYFDYISKDFKKHPRHFWYDVYSYSRAYDSPWGIYDCTCYRAYHEGGNPKEYYREELIKRKIRNK